MIDDIVEMVLKEARASKEQDLTTRIAKVLIAVVRKAAEIIDNETQEERRKKEDEKKGRDFKRGR